MQIKSKKRVADHGEVFTAEREVNAMLDLVKQETEKIDSRFLEPACGDGNFLSEILRRKLDVVEARYKKKRLEFERQALIAVSSIYGIDILEDNVNTCRERLLQIFSECYTRLYQDEINPQCLDSARYILAKNIIWGDALNYTSGQADNRPIIFSEWVFISGNMVKRRDFNFDVLANRSSQPGLFGDEENRLEIADHNREFPAIHFLELSKYE